MRDSPLDSSVLALAAAIRSREISPVEVLEVHIQRLEQVNGALNALIGERFAAARREAQRAEAMIQSGVELPPLHGVPCTIKEFIGVRGMPQTGGILRHQERRANADATLVQRLREAGAIVLGVTNGPEGGIWLETDNRIFGRTRNPWNLRRTPGGSSGGEAALIAAGATPFGVGSDVGGSIRIPSGMCGVVGHKPTGRLVPNTGHFPAPHGPIHGYLTCGPMARRVEDLLPLLRIMAGPDGRDPQTRSWELDETQFDVSRLRVFTLDQIAKGHVWSRMRKAVHDAGKALEDAGARVEPLECPGMNRAFEIWGAMMGQAEGPSYAEILGGEEGVQVWRELLGVPSRTSTHTLPAIVCVIMERLMARNRASLARLGQAASALQQELEATLGTDGILLHPPYTRPAPRHGFALLTPFDAACTAIFNVLEFPSTVVPVGLDTKGLPLAVQCIGKRGSDALTIAAARIIEKSLGGWRRAEPPEHPARPLRSERIVDDEGDVRSGFGKDSAKIPER